MDPAELIAAREARSDDRATGEGPWTAPKQTAVAGVLPASRGRAAERKIDARDVVHRGGEGQSPGVDRLASPEDDAERPAFPHSLPAVFKVPEQIVGDRRALGRHAQLSERLVILRSVIWQLNVALATHKGGAAPEVGVAHDRKRPGDALVPDVIVRAVQAQ